MCAFGEPAPGSAEPCSASAAAAEQQRDDQRSSPTREGHDGQRPSLPEQQRDDQRSSPTRARARRPAAVTTGSTRRSGRSLRHQRGCQSRGTRSLRSPRH
ncbi:hypothetical protein SN15_02990 [Stenotrophomonas maltophilia]|nr:hypothetical protein SN15_02990 [Stenotrophomonas maltophilia]